jgi:hypothetical protein
MGLLDHRRMWHYEVSAPPTDCIQAFVAAFKGRAGLGAKAKWSVRTGSDWATATYEGRQGLGGTVAFLSGTVAQETDTAIGSQVTFQINRANGGRTRCSMALISEGRSGFAGLVGHTSDAGIIRPYMQAVAKELRKLDPAATIESA